MRLRGGTFLSTPSPCLRASVFFVFKRRRHKKSSPYKNFANFANFA